jgi:hypothetical protein
LSGLGLRKVNFDQHISGMRALQSQRAGVSGWHTAQVGKKTFGSVSCFLFEKTDGAHISAMLAVQSQRTGVSQRYLQQRSFGALVHFVEKTW